MPIYKFISDKPIPKKCIDCQSRGKIAKNWCRSKDKNVWDASKNCELEEFKYRCNSCGIGFNRSSFGLTRTCDKCYRKSYAATKKNYADSGHFYPWTIDGKLRKYPTKVIK